MHSKLVPDGQWTSLDQNQLLSYFLAPKVIGNVFCATILYCNFEWSQYGHSQSEKKLGVGDK